MAPFSQDALTILRLSLCRERGSIPQSFPDSEDADYNTKYSNSPFELQTQSENCY